MEIKMPELSGRLKQLRQEKGMTQKDMAQLLEKTERHYQDIEAGKINVPALVLVKLADCFSVSVDYLIGRTDKR